MSSIPNTAMKHAHVHEGEHSDLANDGKPAVGGSVGERARELGDYAQEVANDALGVVKAHPKTAAAIGAAVVAGAAALVGGPALARRLKEDDKPAAKPRKKAAKKG